MTRPTWLHGFLPLLLLLMWGVPQGPAAAQEAPIPRDRDAEMIFDQAIEAFEEGDYGMAYRRFRLVYASHPLNRKTTAAMLMGGKALYRDGRYREAVELLTSLIDQFPTSGYLDEARRTRRLAQQRIEQGAQEAPLLNLGIIFPMQGEDASLTQALFTGVRIAVEEHNAFNDSPSIRMIFRDTRNDAGRASGAVEELARGGVGAVIGPLYSQEAIAAAGAAERSNTVLIAPMANDEAVSEGRRYVFQANPTITTHGRLMARFAMRSLRLTEFGIVAERDRESISERMAEGFQEEVMLQGGDVEFYRVLTRGGDWGRLPEIIGPDTLNEVEALYLPFSGTDATNRITAALTGIDRANGDVRLLGNTEWHDLPSPRRASTYATTYTNDFQVDQTDASVQAFSRRFREITGQNADPDALIGRLAFTGYDVARFLIAEMARSSDRPLHDRLRQAPSYQGLGIRIDFRNGNVNEALYYLRYQDNGARLLR